MQLPTQFFGPHWSLEQVIVLKTWALPAFLPHGVGHGVDGPIKDIFSTVYNYSWPQEENAADIHLLL